MEYVIKNGLFKHHLDSKEKLIAVKLFVNGWVVTDSIGNTKASIRREDNGVKCESWTASFIPEETTVLRVPGLKEVTMTNSNGREYHFIKEKGCFLLDQEGKTWRIKGIGSRRSILDLPDEFSPLDAMVLFCTLQIAEEKISVV